MPAPFAFATTSSLALLLTLVPCDARAGDVEWDAVGDGGTPGTASLNGAVHALLADGTDLYVGGAFTDAGGLTTADFVARWNGISWNALPPLNGPVYAIARGGNTLYVGGAFTNASGNANVDYVAAWNGFGWEGVCNAASGSPFNGNVNALHVMDGMVYIGGSFQNASGIASADYLVACSQATGDPMTFFFGGSALSSTVYALTADANGTLYVGGSAVNIDGNPASDYIAAYDGTWHAMGSGPGVGGGAMDGFVRALATDGTNVYAGGDAVAIAGIPGANRVARWNGTWHAMGPNYFSTPMSINALARDGPLIYAGGNFQNTNGDALADSLVYWDGAAWHTFGSDGAGNGALNGSTNVIAKMGARMIAGGSFTSAGGDALARYVAQAPSATIVLFANGFE